MILDGFWTILGPFLRSFSGMGEKARIELRLERQLDSRGLEGTFFDPFFDDIFDTPRGRLFIDFSSIWGAISNPKCNQKTI